MSAPRPSPTCARSTSSTTSTTPSSRDWAAVAEPRDARAGRRRSPSRASRPTGVLLLLEGTVADADRRRRPHRAGRAPAARRPGSARSPRSPSGAARRAHGRRDRRAGSRSSRADDFRRLALAHPPVHRPRHAAGRAGDGAHHRRSSRTASGWRRWARWPPGSRTSSTTRPRPPSARRPSWPRRSTSSASTLGAFVEAGIERERGRAARRAAARGARRAPRRADGARRARRRRRRGRRCSTRLEDLGVAEAVAARRAAGGRRRRRGLARARGRRSPGPATGAALRWVAASLTARGLAAELQRVDASACRASSARSRPTPTWTAAALVEVDVHEGLETTLIVLGHKLKHTSIEVVRDYDRTLPKLTVRGSELNQVWTNLLDNAIDALGEHGTITIAHAPRRRLRASSTIADDGPGIPRRRAATASSTRSSPPRTSARAPASGSTPRGGSSSSATAARSRSTSAARRAPPSTSGCPDRTGVRPPCPRCTHLDHDHASPSCPRRSPAARTACATGGIWLHLRICLECGHVGCCDDSPNRHATAHARGRRAPDHPLARAGRGLVVVLRGRGRRC